mmetsp:Transcript_40435/g.99910  ORF Transcript_40435/g.99910 Transcript_40435/m.99910 type:complete len:237 (-) Transcript_40435:948-1658(-)
MALCFFAASETAAPAPSTAAAAAAASPGLSSAPPPRAPDPPRPRPPSAGSAPGGSLLEKAEGIPPVLGSKACRSKLLSAPGCPRLLGGTYLPAGFAAPPAPPPPTPLATGRGCTGSGLGKPPGGAGAATSSANSLMSLCSSNLPLLAQTLSPFSTRSRGKRVDVSTCLESAVHSHSIVMCASTVPSKSFRSMSQKSSPPPTLPKPPSASKCPCGAQRIVLRGASAPIRKSCSSFAE